MKELVEIIRCKDCKHWCADYCCRDIKGRSNMFYMEADSFCSHAEAGRWDEKLQEAQEV